MKKLLHLLFALVLAGPIAAQNEIDDDQLGAWYMYFFNADFKNSKIGIQGDYQFRFWDAGGDLEQILLRTGVTLRPEKAVGLYTLGYAYIATGEFGESTTTTSENRIYQEALLPHRIHPRVHLTHRFRYEQRFVENQDFRTRYRYNLFMNILLNNTELDKGTFYVALYNELFINGQRDIGDDRTVQFFDRNRTYVGMGWKFAEKLRMQLGWMKQTTVGWSKGQAQISLHQNW